MIIRAAFFALCVQTLAISAPAKIVAEYRGERSAVSTMTESYSFDVPDATVEYGVSVTAILDAGAGSLRVFDPGGNQMYQHLWSTRLSQERARLPIAQPGTYRVEVSLDGAQGAWRARIVPLPSRASLRWMYASGALLLALPSLLLIGLARRPGLLKLALAGALMMVVGRVMWLIGGVILHIATKAVLEDAVPHRVFLWTQSLSLGIWEGIAATLGVVIVCMAMKRIRASRTNAIAAGIGGGAADLLILGMITVAGLLVMFGEGPKTDTAQFKLAYQMAVTPLLLLVDPLISACGLFCRVVATVLIVGGLRTRAFRPIAGGAFVFGGVLTVTSAARTVELLGPESRWVVLAAVAALSTFAYVLWRRNEAQWDAVMTGGDAPLDAFIRQHDGNEAGNTPST